MVSFTNKNSLDLYSHWPSPTLVIIDGPYGVGGFPGDPYTPTELPAFYEEHIKRITERSTPRTTLWFWNTEIGWALVHPLFEKYGWEYKCCCIWDKGKSHMAGNVNTKTLSKFPVVTEVCVQYVLKPTFKTDNSDKDTMMNWLIREWKRTGLPFYLTNKACGVKDAATRKYFTHEKRLWYMPTTENFIKIVNYANENGKPEGKPYFSLNGKKPATAEEWDLLRPVFNCPFGKTNVWQQAQLMNSERLKTGSKSVHLNQKPLSLIQLLIESSSNPGDVVWDPFAGLATTAIACHRLSRDCYTSEINEEVYKIAMQRLQDEMKQD